jgi:hypothetical protein
MSISDPGRGLVRRLGVTAAALVAFAAASPQRAEALSLASPGAVPSVKYATDGLTTEVRHGGGGGGGMRGGGGFHGGGGGGFRGGGFHGGGFRGGGAAFHGGGFRGGAIHGGGFRAAPVFRGGGYRVAPAFHGYRHAYHRPHFVHRPHFYGHRRHFHRRFYYAPSYYYPRYYSYPRYCRIVWTYYGPRKICRYRPWWRHHWRYRYYGW